MLRSLHIMLDVNFRQLGGSLKRLDPASSVFVLEHDLGGSDYELLLAAVRSAVAQGLGARNRLWWLPFGVYPAGSAYHYVGDEYWPTFEQSTPGWCAVQRHSIKDWFLKFAREYGGTVPTGAFAEFFTIIAWPVNHAAAIPAAPAWKVAGQGA